MKRIIAILLCAILVFSMTACAGNSGDDGKNSSSTVASRIEPDPGPQINLDENGNVIGEATLYIGTENSEYKEYPLDLDYEPTPGTLIDEIARLTGWNIELADYITSGENMLTITFSEKSSLFVGPPEQQKDDFFMHDHATLAQTMLDSIKETMNKNFASNSESIDIYFRMEGGKPLSIDAIDKSWSDDQPYEW